ncbi:MAG: hypothetical protein J6I53_02945 [Treponema sp.]|nr:hypothetical protein [Treponema sp.]
MKKKLFWLWIAFHAAILLSFLISLAVSPRISFGTSLFDILPPSSSLHEVQAADTSLADRTGRAVTILVKSDDFERAKEFSRRFYDSFLDKDGNSDSDFFDTLSFYVDANSVGETIEWLHENRFMLLDSETCIALEEGGASEIASDALSSVYGAFSFSDLSGLEEDPFLLSERIMQKMLGSGAVSATGMMLRDDVLACEKEGAWYVLIRGMVSKRGSSLTGKKSTVRSVFERAEALKADSGGEEIEFIFSGVPFHSYENATSAQVQISLISFVSLILIVLVFLWIFRTPLPAFISALAVSFSCGIGFISVLLFFRGIHVLTFVFGTTLIGTCLDYSIHYFVNWKGNLSCKSGEDVRNRILRGVTLGFSSTEICFLALFFAPFPLLKQVSVFLFTGLASSYLSVVALYPLLKMPKQRGKMVSLSAFSNKRLFRKARILIPLVLSGISLTVIFTNYRSFKIKNNIQELYSMSAEMRRNEIVSATVLDTGSVGWYFIVKADSEELLLQKNEELGQLLDSAIESERLKNYLSVAQFIPSEKTQRRSYELASSLLPLAKEQYEALGIENLAENYENNYRLLKNAFVHPSDRNIPSSIKSALQNLWIGEIDGSFYSCVLPLHADASDESFFREAAAGREGVFFVNKVRDISSQLDELSESMLLMLAFAFVAVLAILLFCYEARVVLKIAAVPVLVTLVTASVLILSGIHLSFFPITAIVLVFGLGLDYIIYAVEGSGESEKADSLKNLNSFAIVLSFITTALSFGALALSTFPPVHTLGLTVFVGLSVAVTSAFCLSKI